MTTSIQPESPAPVNEAIAGLSGATTSLAAVPPAGRAALGRACLRSLEADAESWARSAAEAKGLDPESDWLGEELVLGPGVIARYLQLMARALEQTASEGRPRLPGKLRRDARGKLRVPVIPAKGLYDALVFKGFSGEVVLDDSVDEDDFQDAEPDGPGVAVVLGAGNVTSIAPIDALEQVLSRGRTTLIKLHPHFAPLEPLMRSALAPLIDRGYLAIVGGGVDAGAAAISHDDINLVHVTGSKGTLAAMASESDDPSATLLGGKECKAELGDVTPWIVVPGSWSGRELRAQAENLAGALLSNGSFNCICPKMVITSRHWPQREEFLHSVRGIIAAAAPRPAFYPEAIERFADLVGEVPKAPEGYLPWVLIDDVDPESRPELFERENFLPASAETALDEPEPSAFLDTAVEFANAQISGNLAATIIVQPRQRKTQPMTRAVERAVDELRYGTVAINQFTGIAWVLASLPWGACPGGSLAHPESGFGFGHNPYMLKGIEKSVLEGPFRIAPKPMWFPSNKNPVGIGRALSNLYLKPSIPRLSRVLGAALRG